MLEHVKREHIIKALEETKIRGIPTEQNTKRYRYFLEYEGKRYPNKYITLLANKFAGGSYSETKEFGSRKSRKFLQKNGFKILDAKPEIAPEDDESAFPEGAERYGWHRKRERDRAIVKQAKVKRWKEVGKFSCDVCSFNFEKTYGSHGRGFIEAHHTVPIPELDGRKKTKRSDLALVCSNCHRMLHRGRKLLSVDELRQLVEKAQRKAAP